ncbi:MAG: PilZ domain-containing protein [Acidobacteriia bacterium]|nr:PilZ domain-containing protein [Terriglobia bacterium]
MKNQGNESTIVASTVNISAHGLCIQPRRSFQPGQIAYVLPGPATARACYCRVVWTSQTEAGLEFLN